jgi:hercynine metabolism protein
MAGSGNWLDELETRLNQTLEGFLKANPQQEALLEEQSARDRQQRLRRDRLTLTTEAELQRQGVLRLAEDIRAWQERVERARRAGADDLAGRAEAHVATLMEQGRARWQTLAELGERFEAVERELRELAASKESNKAAEEQATRGSGTEQTGLEADWAAFESQQDLESLRRNLRC